MSKRHRNEEIPTFLPGATEFTDDRDLCDPVFLLEAIKRFPNVFGELFEATDLASRYGRKRMEGNWAMVMLAFVVSGYVDVEPFCNGDRSSEIWKIAGFKKAPTVQTVWNRLTEFEDHFDAFVETANKLIRKAVAFVPEIAENVWVDATGFETHAVLEHCCEDRARCKARGGRPPKFVDRAGEELIKEERHKEAAEPPTDDKKAPNAIESIPEEQAPKDSPSKRKRPYKYFTINGHRYRSLDVTSGARYYSARKRFWFGGYSQIATSMYIGAPLAINIFPADEQEHKHYSELYAKLVTATGVKPQNAVHDRGYSVNEVFEHNTREGVGSVIPFRKPHAGIEREDLSNDFVDMHGIPRCKHCGGPGEQRGAGMGWRGPVGKTPRIEFRCQWQVTPDCAKGQSVSCDKSWRLLNPLSRTTATYHALKKAGKAEERQFRHWRARYKVAGSNIDCRPKRPGLPWQQLRASAALLMEWFRLSLRHGWLAGHRRRNNALPVPFSRDDRALRAMLGKRKRLGLDYPYGKAAARLGLGSADPPKRDAKPRGRPGSRGNGSKVKISTGPIPF